MHSISVNWVSSNVVHRTLSFDVDQSVAPTSFVRGPEICHQSQTHYKVRPAVYFSTLFSILCTLFQHFFLYFPPTFYTFSQTFPMLFLTFFHTFQWIGPLGQFSLRVAMSVCLSVCLRHWMQFFLGLSPALRSHDQFPGLSLVNTRVSVLFICPTS